MTRKAEHKVKDGCTVVVLNPDDPMLMCNRQGKNHHIPVLSICKCTIS